MKVLTLVTAPTSEPVLYTDVKLHAGLDSSVTSGDSWITTTITVARRLVESRCGVALINQTWSIDYDDADLQQIELIHGAKVIPIENPSPITAITKIETTDDANSTDTVSSTYYTLVTGSPARVVFTPDYAWPSHRAVAGVKVTFTAGYGTSAASVPAEYLALIREITTFWWHNRGAGLHEASTPAEDKFPSHIEMQLATSTPSLL